LLTSLQATKLQIPPLRPDILPRNHLLRQLEEGLRLGCKLTLISAPAGFGKTTLLSQWTASTRLPVVWLSLEEADDDLVRFWAYITSAVQKIHPHIGKTIAAVLRSSQTLSPNAVPSALINEMAAYQEKFALVLDDYHVINSRSIQESLDFLIHHLPSHVHLVIATRVDPPLSLTRLRGRGQLSELRTPDLRFTSQEIETYFQQQMNLELPAEDVAVLRVRTEGWIVGMQLAAMSLRGKNTTEMRSFISNLSGSHRYILDYLTDEVILQQPAAVQTFLLHTSILERLSPSLCDSVVEGDIGQQMLSYLESNNLFIIPMDAERRWYRYHHLFAELLHKRLQDQNPDILPDLHQRASQWFEKNGLIADALNHGLVAGDDERVTQLVTGQALFMMEHTELKTLARMMNRLPVSVVHSHPWLCVAYAWLLAFLGQLDRVEPLLCAAEKSQVAASQSLAINADHEPVVGGYIAAVRALVSDVQGDALQASDYARQALSLLPESDLMTRGWIAILLWLSLNKLRQVEASERALAEAVEISRRLGANHIRVTILCNQAVVEKNKGNLRQAADTFRQALATADEFENRSGRQLPVSGYAYTYLATILCEWNDLTAACIHIQTGNELCEKWGEPMLLCGSYLCLAQVLQAMGDWDGSLDAIQKAKQAANTISSWYAGRVVPFEMLTRLQLGQLERAFAWADSLEVNWTDSLDLFDAWSGNLVLARIKVAQGKLKDALEILTQVQNSAEQAGGWKSVIESLTLQALIWQSQAKPELAFTAFSHALGLAEIEGYIRTFVSEGVAMEKLLLEAIARGERVAYASKLLESLGNELGGRPGPGEALVEPLSEREMEVLRLLDTHLTRPQIAHQLYISENTVRSHVRNIYKKLAVNSRDAAVQHAKKLSLI
jgi:LuxR family maltose regulon positive regulatory protein